MTLARLLPAALIAGMMLLLGGCIPAEGAVTGVTVTADGDPVGVLQVCEGRIDGVSLYRSRAGRERMAGAWSANPAATGFSTWSLQAGGDRWTLDDSWEPLKTGFTYSLWGGADDGSFNSTPVEFTVQVLKQLRPGMVRYATSVQDSTGDFTYVYVTTTQAEFEKNACDLI